jgi:hypothetical protein
MFEFTTFVIRCLGIGLHEHFLQSRMSSNTILTYSMVQDII